MTLASERLQLRHGNPDDEFYTPRDEVEFIMWHAAAQSVPIVNRNILCPCDTRESAFVQATTANNAVTYSGLPDTPWQKTNFHNKFIFTNPPFSQLIPFTQKLNRENAQFLIIISINFIGNPLVRRKLLTNEWRVLPTSHGSSISFIRPDGTCKNAPAVWLTNLPITPDKTCRARIAQLTRTHVKGENKIIFSADTCNLPANTHDVLAVPITWPIYMNAGEWRIIGFQEQLIDCKTNLFTFKRWIITKSLAARRGLTPYSKSYVLTCG